MTLDLRTSPQEGVKATWWRQASPGTTYWRCQIPAKHLPGQVVSLEPSSDIVDTPDGFRFPWQRGAAIWQFAATGVRGIIMAEMQDQGIRVLLEVDDNYLVPPPHIPGIMTKQTGWSPTLDTEEDRHSLQAHRKILPWVDGIIVSTEELAARYAAHNTVYHCPNSVDLDDWGPAEFNPQGRRIGFAGSDSHRHDLALIERALDWAWRNGAELVKFGATQRPWRFPHKQIPWTDDVAEYRRSLPRSMNIGLCPLKRGDWADCKSDIKAIEYTLAGVLPIVQDAPPFKDWLDIVPSASTEKDWLKAAKWAVNASDEELTDAWRGAHDFVMSNRLIQQHIGKWREAVAGRDVRA